MKYSPLYLVILLFFFTAIAGCSGKRMPDDTLVFALRSDPLFLNPAIASEMSSKLVTSLIFNSLIIYNKNNEIEGDLAESWQNSPDGKTWTFRLRKDVKWHDGTPFTAKDVKFTFDKLFDSKTNTFNRGLFQVGGVNPQILIPDDYTVIFKLPTPFAPFISNLTQMGILPEHLLRNKDINRDSFNWHPVGTGPFIFNHWKSSERIYLTANKAYFKTKPLLKGVVFYIIPSTESRRIALMTGTADMSEITPEDLRAISSVKELTLYKWDQYAYYYLGFDLTNDLFKDINLRKAINYSCDKETIIRAVFKDNAVRATGPIPPASPFYSGNVNTYPKNTKKAKELLRLSGWKINPKTRKAEKNGKTLSFELIYPSGNAPCEKYSVFLQSQMAECGIEMKLKAMEFSALINNCYPGKFQAVMLNWVENIDPDSFTEWHSSQTGDLGMNFMTYQNKKADLLLEKARKITLVAERKELYNEFQQIVAEDSPYLFLWTPKGLLACTNRVKGFTSPNAAGGLLIKPENIYIKNDGGKQ